MSNSAAINLVPEQYDSRSEDDVDGFRLDHDVDEAIEFVDRRSKVGVAVGNDARSCAYSVQQTLTNRFPLATVLSQSEGRYSCWILRSGSLAANRRCRRRSRR